MYNFFKISYLSLFLIAINISCNLSKSSKSEEKQRIKPRGVVYDLPEIEVINAQLPIKLEEIDFYNSKKQLTISDGKIDGIEKAVVNYYQECTGNDSSYFKIKDIYIGTVQIENQSDYILYWIIYRHISSKINSEILFYNKVKNEFSIKKIDFNIHALYIEENDKLVPSDLKNLFNIKTPEIEFVDFDKDKNPIFRFSRLYHNGTANAIEKLEVCIKEDKMDTLLFHKKWIN